MIKVINLIKNRSQVMLCYTINQCTGQTGDFLVLAVIKSPDISYRLVQNVWKDVDFVRAF